MNHLPSSSSSSSSSSSTAAESSVGSNIFAVASIFTVSILVLLVIRHYLPLRTTPAYLLVPFFLCLALPSSIILLVPIDLASSVGREMHDPKAIRLPDTAILVTWRVTYWLTFVLTWFVLPFLGEFCDSGYRDTRDRSAYSLRQNIRYQMIVLSTGIAGLVYFIWENGFHAPSIKGLLMALAYTWGLILAIGLMGHGLVALPRRLFKNANVSARLRWLQTQAPKIKEKLDDATEKLVHLEQTVIQLKRYKGGAHSEQQDWIDELAETSGIPDMRPEATVSFQSTNPSVPAVVTDRYLADLTRKLKRARHRKARFVDEWSNLCGRAYHTQTILDSATTKKLDFGRSRPDSALPERLSFLTPTMRYQLHMNIIPALRMGFSGILAIASSIIVWSEIIKAFAPQLSIIGLSVVRNGTIDLGGQLIAALWLLYMDTCALYAIQDVKVWGNRALVKRQTYAESACWYSLQVAKLTVPLSYNFITMIPPKLYRETSFYQFLGQLINLTPLGQGFSAFFPCFLLIPVLATLFNLYGKMKGVFGFGMIDDDSEEDAPGFGTGGWREGKALIDRELQAHGADGTLGLGLPHRGASLDVEGAHTDSLHTSAPSHRVLGAARDGYGGQSAFRDESIRDANRQFNALSNQEEEEEEEDSARHFYQDFTERVKNTVDTIDTPEWMKNIGSAFTAPKWMQQAQRNDGGDPALSRWFGGRAGDGRLRL